MFVFSLFVCGMCVCMHGGMDLCIRIQNTCISVFITHISGRGVYTKLSAYVCTHVCAYLHTCIHVYVCTYVCIYIHTCIHVYACMHVYRNMYVHMSTCVNSQFCRGVLMCSVCWKCRKRGVTYNGERVTK